MRWAILLAVAACGRVGFDAVGSATGDDGSGGPGDGRKADGPGGSGGRDAKSPFCATLPCSNGNGSSHNCDGNFCYASCSMAVTQAGGEAICEQWGGTLVSISNASEESCATGVTTVQAWIGYIQAPSTDVAAGWTWMNGQPLGPTSWGSAEPDDADLTEDGQEQCATIDASGLWHDAPCTAQHGFMCVR